MALHITVDGRQIALQRLYLPLVALAAVQAQPAGNSRLGRANGPGDELGQFLKSAPGVALDMHLVPRGRIGQIAFITHRHPPVVRAPILRRSARQSDPLQARHPGED
ncbi:hypothetical protein D3C80_1010650 [compost metagenome]